MRASPRVSSFKEVAKACGQVISVKEKHESRYRNLPDNVGKDLEFAPPEPAKWICRKCGFMHEGPKALRVGPACDHPQAYQAIHAEDFWVDEAWAALPAAPSWFPSVPRSTPAPRARRP